MSNSTGSIFQKMRIRTLQEEECHIQCLSLCRLEETGISSSDLDFNRSNLLSSNQSIKVQQPLFAKGSYIQIDAVQSSQCTDGVSSIFKHTRCLNDIRRLEELRQRA